ncbi:MAG: thiamine-phosphate kinase [Terracidiphilus sp.]
MPAPRNRPKSAAPGELTLLARIRARAAQTAHPDLLLGIGDDCALLRPDPGDDLAVTTDLSIAGRHFRLDWHPPESVGHRTLARGLSDLAAMGARPIAAFLSLGLPPALVQSPKARSAREPRTEPHPAPWIDRFLDGFLALAHAHRTVLAGGDLAESPVALADIVLTGAVARGKALLRSGARPGDLLYVTGALGGSAAGLARLSQMAQALARSRSKARSSGLPPIPAHLKAMLAPHLYPHPRIAQGLWLSEHSLATAAIDLSDGLSTDLAHICEASSVAAELDQASLPIHPGATLAQALHGGEEYELLFTASPEASIPASIEGVPVTRIGRIAAAAPAGPPITLLTAQGAKALPPSGWEHFT